MFPRRSDLGEQLRQQPVRLLAHREASGHRHLQVARPVRFRAVLYHIAQRTHAQCPEQLLRGAIRSVNHHWQSRVLALQPACVTDAATVRQGLLQQHHLGRRCGQAFECVRAIVVGGHLPAFVRLLELFPHLRVQHRVIIYHGHPP